MPKSILTIISKDGNATEYYEKSVVTEHISKMEPLKEKFPKLYFYKFVIANLGLGSRAYICKTLQLKLLYWTEEE